MQAAKACRKASVRRWLAPCVPRLKFLPPKVCGDTLLRVVDEVAPGKYDLFYFPRSRNWALKCSLAGLSCKDIGGRATSTCASSTSLITRTHRLLANIWPESAGSIWLSRALQLVAASGTEALAAHWVAVREAGVQGFLPNLAYFVIKRL